MARRRHRRRNPGAGTIVAVGVGLVALVGGIVLWRRRAAHAADAQGPGPGPGPGSEAPSNLMVPEPVRAAAGGKLPPAQVSPSDGAAASRELDSARGLLAAKRGEAVGPCQAGYLPSAWLLNAALSANAGEASYAPYHHARYRYTPEQVRELARLVREEVAAGRYGAGCLQDQGI